MQSGANAVIEEDPEQERKMEEESEERLFKANAVG